MVGVDSNKTRGANKQLKQDKIGTTHINIPTPMAIVLAPGKTVLAQGVLNHTRHGMLCSSQ